MKFIRRIIQPGSLLDRNGKYILIFLNGFLLALLVYFYTEKQYEKNLFASMAAYIQSQLPSSDTMSPVNKENSLLIKSMRLVHELGEGRVAVFGSNPVKGIKADYIQPATIDLMTGQGACGSYAYVLGRLLQEMNFDVRLPQMMVNNQQAGHILVEAKASHGWVVLDASFNAAYKKENGELAGFADVHANWDYYQQQVPANYNMSYRYEGVRYTNWDKIPLLMPLIKNVMYWTMGKEKTDNYSLRTLGLKKYNVLFNITLGAYLLVVLFSINIFIKAKRKAAIAGKGSSSGERNIATLA